MVAIRGLNTEGLANPAVCQSWINVSPTVSGCLIWLVIAMKIGDMKIGDRPQLKIVKIGDRPQLKIGDRPQLKS